jgi:large subunit ribosomal protein L29
MKSQEDYTSLKPEELAERLTERVEELENLRMQQSTQQLPNPLRIRFVRRDIARLKTIMHQHEQSKQESK